MPPSTKHSRLFVQRFKTTLCEKYQAEGTCPYADRCMFAHGADDLRTEAMNIMEGLINDSAVRKWQRRRRAAVRGPPDADTPTEHSEGELSRGGSLSVDPLVAAMTSRRGAEAATGARTEARRFRHDPYAGHDVFVTTGLASPVSMGGRHQNFFD